MEQVVRLKTVLILIIAPCLLLIKGSGSERLFHSRDHSDIELQNHPQADAILSPEAAQQYLVKYGWVSPVRWEEQAFEDIPELDQAPQDVFELISEGDSAERTIFTSPNKTEIRPDFSESLKKFQESNGLNATGILDTPTKLAMNKPRCGVPDIKAPSKRKNATLSFLATNETHYDSSHTADSRRKRSILSKVVDHFRRKRENREAVENENSMSFSKRTLKWRLMGEGYSMQLTIEQQRRILNMAFRMWSEVIPLQFEEDLTGGDIDIRVGFGTGQHLGCSQAFDGVGQQFAHAWYLGDIHFDDDEHFVGPSSEQGISLLKVAVHEIGHALGLPHINRIGSVMQPNYTPQGKHFELDWEDRKAVQKKYGACDGSFSTIFDWVRKERNSRGEVFYRFNTYFFKTGWYWMYENKRNRTRFGDPLPIKTGWKGLPENSIDAYVHVWNWNLDAQYFFKGTQVWRYDPEKDMAYTEDWKKNKYPQLIADTFPGAPIPVDAAFFDKKDRLIYFFRGNNVTAFSIEKNKVSDHFPKRIMDVFPAVDPSDHPVGNIDAVYYSYTDQSTYFIKDSYYWKVVKDQERQVNASLPVNGLWPRKKINSKWYDICDVHPSVLFNTT
ncbi:matrix metalloproteinase-21-like [Hyla sarda]|uniref:matrix metalloproteinase-21-like n=1 Tax=Hyla sarda TaxID=327740 RepID=UPI0024C2D865|nr:matrix metalloproteinase-21-like [Hyla sarda]XP_056373314.1 matrix metalloproteinase-21-like [Hyla sarda]XP_056373315.1 matrix metalloproteinase-21-like [Hyla sarda]XP_056373316.1 matrix metalloproteinase-21-like [Hyla sarda]